MTSTEAATTSAATAAGRFDFTTHWIGLTALGIFAVPEWIAQRSWADKIGGEIEAGAFPVRAEML